MRPSSPGLSARVREWLARHGSPVSSARLLEMFLRMAALPEDRATRLLAPSLEGAGLRYEPGAGWCVGMAPAAVASLRVVAVPGQGAGEMALAVVDPPGWAREAAPAELAGGGVTFVVRDRADALPLRAWLAARGLPAPEAVVPWRAALRGKIRLPRGAGVDTVAAALGLRWNDEESPRSTALAIAGCLGRAEDAAGAPSGIPPADAAVPCRVPREQIDALPAAPGTYRFYAEDGSLLYVGKARDLRRRVASYFRAGRRAGHGARFLPHAVRLEHQVEGSELEALLREARALARRSPPGNVQLAVHERGRQYAAARAWALLLPHAHDGGVTAVLVRDGRYLGHLTLGPRGGGLPAARRLLARAIPTGGGPGACKAAASSRDGLPDRDTEILMSWLARNRNEVSRVEMDSFRTPSEALRALREAARSVRLHPDRVIVRGAPRRT